jgi:hypothetical protein
MQQEIIKHSKKVQNILENPGKSFWEKSKEILIEVLIIVFAVSLSIWLHSWSEHRHDMKKVKEFAIDIKGDLKSDIGNFEETKARLQSIVNDLNKDSLNVNNTKEINIVSVFRFPNNGNFEGFKTSGNIGLIEDKEFKTKLLHYYQQYLPAIDLLENNLQKTAERLRDELKTETVINYAILKSPQYHRLTEGYIDALKSNIGLYEIIIEKAKDLEKTIASFE